MGLDLEKPGALHKLLQTDLQLLEPNVDCGSVR
jgi:hypothetical protein